MPGAAHLPLCRLLFTASWVASSTLLLFLLCFCLDGPSLFTTVAVGDFVGEPWLCSLPLFLQMLLASSACPCWCQVGHTAGPAVAVLTG